MTIDKKVTQIQGLFIDYIGHWLSIINWLTDVKQLLDEVEHDVLNYQNRCLCYLPKPKVEADNTDTRFW